MSIRKFLILVFVLISISWFLVYQVFKLSGPDRMILNIIIGFFTVFCILMFLAFEFTRQSKDLNLFTRIFLVSVFVKMIFFVFLIFFGIQKLNCERENIIIPCLVVYVLFTIFETYFLMILSKRKGIQKF